MLKKYLIGIVAALLIAGIGITVVVLATKEPTYQGKRVSHWIDLASKTPEPPGPTAPTFIPQSRFNSTALSEAKVAMRAIGPVALPYIVKAYTQQFTGLQRLRIKLKEILPASIGRAIPAPPTKVQGSAVGSLVREIISHAGTNAIPQLILMSQDDEPLVRNLGLRYLSMVAFRAKTTCIPALAPFLTSTDEREFKFALDALQPMRSHFDSIVPALISSLTNRIEDRLESGTNSSANDPCQRLIGALGGFGPSARPAVEVLNQIAVSTNMALSATAVKALRQIVATNAPDTDRIQKSMIAEIQAGRLALLRATLPQLATTFPPAEHRDLWFPIFSAGAQSPDYQFKLLIIQTMFEAELYDRNALGLVLGIIKTKPPEPQNADQAFRVQYFRQLQKEALGVLTIAGRFAKPVLPEIIELLEHEGLYLSVLDVLAAAGPEAESALPILMEHLRLTFAEDSKARSRQELFQTIVAIARDNPDHVAPLEEFLGDDHQEARSQLLNSLKGVGAAGAPLVERLVEIALEDAKDHTQIRLIGEIVAGIDGSQGTPLLPLLEPHLNRLAKARSQEAIKTAKLMERLGQPPKTLAKSLLPFLTNKLNPWYFDSVSHILQLDPNNQKAILFLTQALAADDRKLALRSAHILLRANAIPTQSALLLATRELEDILSSQHTIALELTGNLGSIAKELEPTISLFLEHKDASVRNAAEQALEEIRG